MDQYQDTCNIANRKYYTNALCVAKKIGLVDPNSIRMTTVGDHLERDVKINTKALEREIKKLVKPPQLLDYALQNYPNHCEYWIQCIIDTCHCFRRSERFGLTCFWQ